MNKKVVITLMVIGIFIFSVFTGIYIYKIMNTNNKKISNINEINKNNTITEKSENTLKIGEETISINSQEEKITPNTKLVLRKYYEQCGHSINEYVEMPSELINMTREELQEQYKDWSINVFSEKEVILIKIVNDFCNEHFVLKELDGYIAIYKIDKNGKETLKEKTAISTKYLTETDKEHLKNEIKIFGIENLNKYIEDFE